MSTRLKQKEEKILQILERLTQENAKGTPIIVEGKKDIETLKTLAVKGKIISAKTGGKSFLDVISEIEKSKAREVILLLDFDRRGKEWTKRLKQNLEKTKIKPNLTFWTKLSKLVGKDVKDIESLATYMETLKRKICNS
ncbi:MAG: toprim domain-containing protein [Candidatus Bathyarchaeota archaeon]|nr:toprim domain-containing protein [Candidatus Bathyarchaeota archaeon]